MSLNHQLESGINQCATENVFQGAFFSIYFSPQHVRQNSIPSSRAAHKYANDADVRYEQSGYEVSPIIQNTIDNIVNSHSWNAFKRNNVSFTSLARESMEISSY